MNKERFIENEYVQIWYENGIVYQVFKPECILTLDVAKKVVEARLSVSNKMTTPIFIDLTNVVTTNTAARKFLAKGEALQFLSAGAFLLDNELMRLAGNVFIYIDKPLIPTKLFTDRDKAEKWLEQFKYLN